VHSVLDDVIIFFLEVDWDDRAAVAEVGLHLVDIDLGEIGDKISNSWSRGSILGSGSSMRNSLLPGRHIIDSGVGFEVLEFVFIQLGVFPTNDSSSLPDSPRCLACGWLTC
jgi:hypothetical protein